MNRINERLLDHLYGSTMLSCSFEFEMMQILAELFDQLDPKSSRHNHFEVPLTLMIVLAQEFPNRSKEISEDKNY